MNIGRMTTRLELQHQESDTNELGETVLADWRTKATIWGDWKEDASGVTVVTRYYPGVSTCHWRLKLAGCCETDADRYFNLSSVVDPDQRRRTLVITAQEAD